MKTSIIAIIATIGIASSSYAQKLMLGPRAGIDIGTVAWDSTSYGTNKSTILGLIGGAQLDVWFSDALALSTGILLDQKGWHEYNMTYPTATNDLTLNYIELPLFLKVGFSTGSFQPYVFAGPSIGYMFWGYTRQHGKNEIAFKIDEVLNKFDFSIVGGAGLAYNLPSGTQISIDGEYAFGLSDILSSDDYYGERQGYFNVGYWPLNPVGAIKTRDVRIAAGVLFPIN